MSGSNLVNEMSFTQMFAFGKPEHKMPGRHGCWVLPVPRDKVAL